MGEKNGRRTEWAVRLRIVTLSLLLVLSLQSTWASDFGNALDAADRGDYATALSLWRPLAQQGNALAQYNLGLMYFHGLGVVRDYREAVKWYRLAAQQGNPIAQYNLGMMYFNGLGVAQDPVRAHMWLNLSAAAQGHPDAVKDRDSAAARMTARQIAEAQAMARRCEAEDYEQCD
jgi:TPR repeat protein